MELTIRAKCVHLPGSDSRLHQDQPSPESPGFLFGIQRDGAVIGLVPAGETPIVLEAVFRVTERGEGKTNFLGPYAKGTVTERFFYLSWVEVGPGGGPPPYGRVKVHISHLPWYTVEQAAITSQPLTVELSLTDDRGRPRCGSIRAGEARWQV